MKKCRTFFLGKLLQFRTISIVLLSLGKINIPGYCLNIKSGSSYQNRNMFPGINFLHCFFCHLLKAYNVKFFVRHKLIYKIMGNPLHFRLHDFCRSNIHIFINLHGICRYDLTANSFCQINGQSGFSYCSRSSEDNKRFFHNLSCFL